MTHQRPKLPYEMNALEPHYLASTLEFHYGKHHQAYVDKLNAALEGTGMESTALEELMGSLDKVPEAKRTAVRNNGGGHYNHTLFWMILGPNSADADTAPTGKVAEQINAKWGSFDKFKEEFSNKAATLFGSGWTWLVVNKDGSLDIENTPNQDNCLMNSDRKPIMVLDVWEHAYYLEHQNKRPAFIQTFFKMVNWQQVETNYANATGGKAIIDSNQLVAA